MGTWVSGCLFVYWVNRGTIVLVRLCAPSDTPFDHLEVLCRAVAGAHSVYTVAHYSRWLLSVFQNVEPYEVVAGRTVVLVTLSLEFAISISQNVSRIALLMVTRAGRRFPDWSCVLSLAGILYFNTSATCPLWVTNKLLRVCQMSVTSAIFIAFGCPGCWFHALNRCLAGWCRDGYIFPVCRSFRVTASTCFGINTRTHTLLLVIVLVDT